MPYTKTEYDEKDEEEELMKTQYARRFNPI
jgi:hypothetical protein